MKVFLFFLFQTSLLWGQIHPLDIPTQKKLFHLLYPVPFSLSEDTTGRLQGSFSPGALKDLLPSEVPLEKIPNQAQIRHAIAYEGGSTLIVITENNCRPGWEGLQGWIGIGAVQQQGNKWAVRIPLRLLYPNGQKGQVMTSEAVEIGPHRWGVLFSGSYEKGQQEKTQLLLYEVTLTGLRLIFSHLWTSGKVDCFKDEPRALPLCPKTLIEPSFLSTTHHGYYDLQLHIQGQKTEDQKWHSVDKKVMYRYSPKKERYEPLP